MANYKKDGTEKAKREQLTEEQKEMRRAYRAKLKKEKDDTQELNTTSSKEEQ